MRKRAEEDARRFIFMRTFLTRTLSVAEQRETRAKSLLDCGSRKRRVLKNKAEDVSVVFIVSLRSKWIPGSVG